jgi:hypothetical protein
MNKIHKFYWENYLSHKKENIFSFKRCWLYFDSIFKDKLLILFNKEKKLFNVKSILDIWWWEWDKIHLLKNLINEDIKMDVLELSWSRINEWLKKFNNINFFEWDMINYEIKKKYDLITFFTSLMFIKNKKELNYIINKFSNNLNKNWYIIIFETLVSSHYTTKYDKKGYLGFSIEEIDDLLLNHGFTKITNLKMYKKIFWKTIWYLSEKIWFTNTIFLEKIIPAFWNNYWNFIVLYKKK